MKISFKAFHIILKIVLITATLLSACGASNQKKSFKIGVINPAPPFEPILDGFKAGMEEAGFVEGQNLTYIYADQFCQLHLYTHLQHPYL